MIVNSKLLLDFESDQNRQSNSDFRLDSTTKIGVVTPNCISLHEFRFAARRVHTSNEGQSKKKFLLCKVEEEGGEKMVKFRGRHL